MQYKKLSLLTLLFIFFCRAASALPLYSPTWGFSLDLPEEYEYTGGDNKDRFSFENPDGACFDIVVYHSTPGNGAPYASVEAMAEDVQRRLNNSGDFDFFTYRQKNACILELSFSLPGTAGTPIPISGWALCLELEESDSGGDGAASGEERPLLLAMAYGPAGRNDLQPLHFSALDSLAPERGDMLVPGPVTEYAYPRETRVQAPVFGLGVNAWIFREDAEAAQAFIDREFTVLARYADSPVWQEAWSRFYRAIYRDSFDRIADAAFQIERALNVPPLESRDFAEQVLKWVQSFRFERNFMGSDFVNLVSAAFEGRGDCDSMAMLWAIIMKQASIPSAIMVSRYYSHAMGLADLPGSGARFEIEGKNFLVAETTANVPIGLIGEDVSGVEYWLGIPFE